MWEGEFPPTLLGFELAFHRQCQTMPQGIKQCWGILQVTECPENAFSKWGVPSSPGTGGYSQRLWNSALYEPQGLLSSVQSQLEAQMNLNN